MSSRRFAIYLFVFYLLLSVGITYPLITRFGSSIYCVAREYVLEASVPYSTPVRHADSFSRIWKFWWQKEAYQQGIDDDFCPLLGVSGVPVEDRFLDLPILEFVGKYLAILTNEVFAYNFLMLLSFPLAALAMYLLAFYVTKSRWAAALAGLIYAFSPLHRHQSFEWVGMAQWHWLPLYVLALLKLDKKKTTKWALLTGLLFSITLVENYYYGYFAVFFTLAFVLFRLGQGWLVEHRFYLEWKTLRKYLLTLGTILVLTLPVTSLFIGESSRRAAGQEGEIEGFIRESWPRFAFSARPWHYLFPDVNHPVFGKLTEKVYAWIATKPPYFLTEPFYPREHSLYLGWTALLLSVIAVLCY